MNIITHIYVKGEYTELNNINNIKQITNNSYKKQRVQ